MCYKNPSKIRVIATYTLVQKIASIMPVFCHFIEQIYHVPGGVLDLAM